MWKQLEAEHATTVQRYNPEMRRPKETWLLSPSHISGRREQKRSQRVQTHPYWVCYNIFPRPERRRPEVPWLLPPSSTGDSNSGRNRHISRHPGHAPTCIHDRHRPRGTSLSSLRAGMGSDHTSTGNRPITHIVKRAKRRTLFTKLELYCKPHRRGAALCLSLIHI